MIYAHIFRSRMGGFRLILTRTPSLTSDSVISETECTSATAAKQEAKASGAKPWNY